MRLTSLDLDRYGPFTGKRLEFRPDAKLHIVFGPNEAGKSCSLAAVTDLLFGFDKKKSQYDFLHPGRELRIGAGIRDRSGAELAFWRRKTKPLLSDASDTPILDEALAPFLGGLSRDVFKRAFGLDAEALRLSGEELKRTDGDLGAALFSAASGLRGFNDLRTTLEKEADGLFGERRAGTRLFYQAHDRYKAASDALKKAETRAGDLRKLRDALDENAAALGAIDGRRVALRAEAARLQRLRRAVPILKAIQAMEDEAAALGELPSAPPGFGEALLAALRAAGATLQALDDATLNETRARAEFDAIAVDPAMLALADDIDRLRDRASVVADQRAQRPRVQAEADAETDRLAAIASGLGLPNVEAVLVGQPDAASFAALQALLDRGQALEQALKPLRDNLAALETDLADKRRERQGRGALRDPRSLREQLAALTPFVRTAQQAQALDDAVAAEAATLADAAARLSPRVDIDALGARPAPSRESIAEHAARAKAIDEQTRDAQKALDDARRECETLARTLADLSALGAPPTPERIAAARTHRDAVWAGLSDTLFGRSGALSGAPLAGAAARFETAVSDADRLADAALLDAARVSQHAAATRRHAERSAQATGLQDRLAALAQERANASAAWRDAWKGLGVEPLSPAEMTMWRAQAEALIARRSDLQAQRSAAAQAHARVATALPSAAALVTDLGLSPMAGLPFEAIVRRIEQEIDRVAETWNAARDLDVAMAALAEQMERAQASLRAAETQHASWSATFQQGLPRIGLPSTASIAEAKAIVALWGRVPAIAEKRAGLLRRIAGMTRDAEDLDRALAEIAARAAPDLADLEPRAAVEALRQRLEAAKLADTRRLDAGRRLEEASLAVRAARDDHDRVHQALLGQAARIGALVDAELEETATRLAARDRIASTIAARREELGNAADGADEAGLRDALATYDADAATVELLRIDDEERRLEDEGKVAYAAHQQAQAQLAALQGATAAELALQQRRSAEAEMLEAAREWAVLSIAAAMVGTAVARQRQNRQEPLMARAGELFGLMTGGRYEGLGQSFDEDDDAPHLVGRRAGGSEVAVTGMSEGTRDQLYLSLRLAYVEDYASRAEPAPFLGDDLFASFDDGRTANGLRALAAIGGAVQPILFTHHGFVVDAARRELGADVDIVQLG